MRYFNSACIVLVFTTQCFYGCGQSNNSNSKRMPSTTNAKSSANFLEGKDYQTFERARILDKAGFTQPQEACSILLPKGWHHESGITWNAPGSSCAGTFSNLSAKSPDGKYSLEMYPDVIYAWNTNPQLMQFYQSNSSNCSAHEPVRAEEYLRNIFLQEIGNPQVIKIEENPGVVAMMRENNETNMNELRQYGAGQMRFDQTAINAQVKWSDGSEGIVMLGSSILENNLPNVYNGTTDKLYTTQVTKRTVFRFPATQSEQAKNQFSVIMSSIRTNPAWKEAVSKFWREARQQSHIVHVGKIRMMDERTRQIGEQATRNGQERLKSMDSEMRSWERRQNSQDYMHTEFIKTIREVENYRDETGKYEMSAGYDHVWSRGDGNSFILSNSPTFNPATVFQDQNWKEMKKVH